MSTITFRADEPTEQALRGLMSDDTDRSTAVREAIRREFEELRAR